MILKALCNFILFIFLELFLLVFLGAEDISTVEKKEGGEAGDVVLEVESLFGTIAPGTQVTFTTTPPSFQSSFSLLNDTVTLSRPLQRPSFCKENTPCHVIFHLNIFSVEGIAKQAEVKLTILPTHIATPFFPQKSLKLQAKRSAPVGFKLAIPLAATEEEDALLTYSIQPVDTTWSLLAHNDTTGRVNGLELQLLKRLNKESHYNLLVVASRNDNPSISCELQVLLEVVVEKGKRFELDLYEGAVNTDDDVGTVVVKTEVMNVEEKDAVRYYFPLKTETLYGKNFEINEKTGVITLKSPLKSNPQSDRQVNFLIMADVGSNPIPLSTNIRINIINSNAHQPQISLKSAYLQGKENVLEVEENLTDAELGTLLVSDEDSNEAGMVDCRVESKVVELSRLDDHTFKLILKQALDHESQKIHKFDISCKDFGNPPLSNTLQVILMVKDTDDHPPVFHPSSYSVSLVEENLVGTKIMKVSVTDGDSDEANKQVSFFLEPQAEHFFSIDQTTGKLSTLVTFDRESRDHYSFYVFATSGAKPLDVMQLNSSLHVAKALVNVTIIDIDDEVAKFTQPWFTFEVMENQSPGTLVGRVMAEDKDLPPNNHFIYSLAPYLKDPLLRNARNIPRSLPFEVHASKGDIRTTRPLDREAKNKYDFKVYAGNESTTVYVTVIDINDNPPTFVNPSPNSCLHNQVIEIKGNLTLSKHLSKLSATDLDQNDLLSYSIVSGNDMKQFGIDEHTGELFWNSYLSGLSDSQSCKALLKVRVQDRVQHSDVACLQFVLQECLSQQKLLQQQVKSQTTVPAQSSGLFASFKEFYFFIIVLVLVCCVAIVVVLTSAICITRHKTRRMKEKSRMMMMQDPDLKSSQFPFFAFLTFIPSYFYFHS